MLCKVCQRVVTWTPAYDESLQRIIYLQKESKNITVACLNEEAYCAKHLPEELKHKRGMKKGTGK